MSDVNGFVTTSARPPRPATVANSFEGEKALNKILWNGDVEALRIARNRYPRGATPHAFEAWACGLDLNNPAVDLPESPSAHLWLAMHYSDQGDFEKALVHARSYADLVRAAD